MKNVIDNVRVGMTCDSCGYDEGYPDGFTKADINTKCPKCGEVMFTDKDFSEYLGLKDMVDGINGMARFLQACGVVTARPIENAETVKVTKDDLQPGETYAQAAMRKVSESVARYAERQKKN